LKRNVYKSDEEQGGWQREKSDLHGGREFTTASFSRLDG